MTNQSLKIHVSPAVGEVSAIYTVPENPLCLFTLAHGAGAGMYHSFMEQLAESLSAEGIATLRFNFPFAENKKGRPDWPAVAHATIEAAMNKARELNSDLPLFVSGKSFGGRMSSQYLADHPECPVSGLVFYGFPLHPAGKPSTDRADHLKKLNRPMLFLQGSKDALASWELIERVSSTLHNATLVRLEGADHSFKAGKKDIISLLVKETRSWIDSQIGY